MRGCNMIRSGGPPPLHKKGGGDLAGCARNLKSLRNFEKMVHEKGVKAAAEQRDQPFGGIVGRYPPVEEE